MTEHTPGPWKIYEHYGVKVRGRSFPVAHCPVVGTNGEHEANARLIAAAPDMLAALQDLATWVDPNENVEDVAPLNKARDAIDEALGKRRTHRMDTGTWASFNYGDTDVCEYDKPLTGGLGHFYATCQNGDSVCLCDDAHREIVESDERIAGFDFDNPDDAQTRDALEQVLDLLEVLYLNLPCPSC